LPVPYLLDNRIVTTVTRRTEERSDDRRGEVGERSHRAEKMPANDDEQ